MSAPAAIEVNEVCTFLLDGMLFGIELTYVQEVIRHQEMTPVPLAAAEVAGLINLRGQIVTALHMRKRLGLPPRSGDQPSMNVVIRLAESTVSLLVDDIGDVVTVAQSAFEATPETLEPGLKETISGVYKLETQLLLLLNPSVAVR